MIEDIYKIQFKGAAFTQETILPFFDKENERISIIYGRNGSGKSTVSKAIMKAAGEDVDGIESAVFLCSDNSSVNLANTNEKSVYVFNEQYIVDNVKLKKEGLDTIVMLGKQVDLDAQISKAEVEKLGLQKQQETLEKEHRQYEDPLSPVSPQYYFDKIKKMLTGDTNWAGRESAIKEGRRNASVSESVIKSLAENKPNDSLETLESAYKLKFGQLEQAKIGEGKITTLVKAENLDMVDEISIIKLLAQKIEKPELTEREQYLLSLLNTENSNKLEKMKLFFSDSSAKKCPFCLQEVSEEYRSNLCQSILKVLSRVVEEHKNSLAKCKINEIYFDTAPFEIVDKELLKQCDEQVYLLNTKIKEVNNLIQKKMDNPYESIILSRLEINSKIVKLREFIDKLKEKIVLYNEPFENITRLKQELIKLNNDIAYYQIKADYDAFNTQIEKKKEKEKEIKQVTDALGKANKLINELKAQKESVDIAVDIINENLKYVFFSSNKLEIKVENRTYKLLSSGSRVRPQDISLGERNVLALCYFFTEILTQKEKDKAYSNELLVVIDDPISSFDIENKVGIMSLLKSKTGSILRANLNTKVIILSHDIQAVFDLEKMCAEVNKKVTREISSSCKYRLLELTQKDFRDFRYKKHNEYTELIQEIYNFALYGSEDRELMIGNVMRRALEGFSTFCFKLGIDEVSCNPEVLEMLGDDFKDYFENLMYRLVLNSESHMEESIRGIPDSDFCKMYTKEEKQKTARHILVFLYLINPLHVKVHLEGISDASNNIEQWKEIIKNGEGNLTNEGSLNI